MNNWQQLTLGNVADIKLSNVDKITNKDEKVVRLCNYTDVYRNSFINKEKAQGFMIASCSENEYEKFILKKGQVAITKDSETTDDIGVSSYIHDDFDDVVLGYHLSLITPYEDKLDGKFLHYWLNTKQVKRYFENNAGGSGQRCTLTLDCIKSIPLYLPDIQSQLLIGKILFDLDAKIELNNSINDVLEEMAKTIFDYWFVQFEFPDKNGKPYRSSNGSMVWNEMIKREIPLNWAAKRLKEFAKTSSGGTPLSSKSEYYYNGEIPWVNSGELNKSYILQTRNYITTKGLENSNSKMLNSNTLLVALYGATAGKVSLLQIPACTNQAICAILPKSNLFTNYLKYAFTNLYKYLINLSSGSARDNLSQDLLNDLHFIIPDELTLNSFDKIIISIIQRITINIKQNIYLKEVRDWLLPMLMNGQVRVK